MAAASSDDLPLFQHRLNAKSSFTPEALLDAVRRERGLALESVPRVCLLDFDGDITDWLAASGRAEQFLPWACFHTTMFSLRVNGEMCGIVPRTIGGPYAVLVAEQLASSGAQLILGLTSAGRISPNLPLPSFVIATAAIRDEGTSYHYLPAARTVTAPADLRAVLRGELCKLGRAVEEGTVWTTDAPYRETDTQIREHAQAGVLAVEMQAASLFAFGQARSVKTGIVCQVTNGGDHDGEPFNKGSRDQEYNLFQAICRAGLRYLETMS
jgi:uridine phosphorylase